MGSAVPEEPVLFIKPETALSICGSHWRSHPISVQFIMKSTGGVDWRDAASGYGRACPQSIAGYGVALDLTLRDVQGKMRKPGSRGKRLKRLITLVRFPVYSRGGIYRRPAKYNAGPERNGEQRQQGTTADMIHKIVPRSLI